jgi:hypothetical protein
LTRLVNQSWLMREIVVVRQTTSPLPGPHLSVDLLQRPEEPLCTLATVAIIIHSSAHDSLNAQDDPIASGNNSFRHHQREVVIPGVPPGLVSSAPSVLQFMLSRLHEQEKIRPSSQPALA